MASVDGIDEVEFEEVDVLRRDWDRVNIDIFEMIQPRAKRKQILARKREIYSRQRPRRIAP